MTPPPVPERPGAGVRPKQLSQSEILDQTPEPTVVGQRRFDAPQRRQTSPGIMATRLPPAPEMPLEGKSTLPAPRHDAATIRVRTPVSPVAVQLPDLPTKDAPQSTPGGSLPPPSLDVRDARIAAQERELERLRALRSAPPDKGAWSKLWFRLASGAVVTALAILTALGSYVVSKLGQAEDDNAALRQGAKKTKERAKSRDELWNDWADRLVAVVECRHKQQSGLNKRQFPETQRAEPGPWPVYKNDCGEIPERPRERATTEP